MESQNIAPVALRGVVGVQQAVVDIKCIVFRIKHQPSVPAVVVVIDQRCRVDQRKVAALMEHYLGPGVTVNRQDVAMVDRSRLFDVVGFPVGEVPPFGFSRADVVRIVDIALVHDDALVRFGPEDGCVVIRGEDLLKDGGKAADVVERGSNDGIVGKSGAPMTEDGLCPIGCGCFTGEPHRFEGIMRVVRKRKLAKRLLFATVVPARLGGRHHAYGRNLRTSGSLVWRHPETGQPCELQIIIGKTIEQRYGQKVMEQAILKRVVKGGYVRITGVIQKNTKNSACVDVVVHDLETFVTPPIEADSDSGNGVSSMPEPLPQRPQQQPYVNLNTLKIRKKKKKALSEEDLLPEYRPVRTCHVTMVTTMKDLMRLRDALSTASAVSLDAEWRPSTRQGRSNPVSVLQLGIVGSNGNVMEAFLVDMLELCFYRHDGSFDRPLTDEQIMVSDILETMFDAAFPKLGFGLRYDVKRLRESYPWLPCFRGRARVAAHVDVGMLARLAGKVKVHKNLSLSKLTAAVLSVRLSKEEQMSDWGHRPLDERQVAYASNDVACLIDIYDAIVEEDPSILSGKRPMEFVSLGLTELGTGRHSVGWGVAGNGSGSGWYSGDEQFHGISSALEMDPRPQQPKKLPLKACTCDLTNVRRYLGEYVAKSGKEGALTAMLGVEEAKKYNGAPRGGALIELANAFLFFVNVPSRNYPNEFIDGKMSWYSSRGQTLDHPVVKRILGGEKDMTLWCRRDRERYVYFGSLSVDSVIEQEDGTLKVWLNLQDWETISTNPTVMHILSGNHL